MFTKQERLQEECGGANRQVIGNGLNIQTRKVQISLLPCRLLWGLFLLLQKVMDQFDGFAEAWRTYLCSNSIFLAAE
jgi:hypothetical protein